MKRFNIYLTRFILCFWTFVTLPAFAQQPQCSDDPYYSKLDFWIGNWHVYDDSGKLVGTNQIQKVLNGCAIEEHWTDTEGGKGKSLFYVESKDSIWHQIWVTEQAKAIGGQKHKVLVAEGDDGSITFQGHYFYQDKRIEDRTILTPKPDGSVEQLIERSVDGEQTWKTGFLGIYRKIK